MVIDKIVDWRPSDKYGPEAQLALDMARRALMVAPGWVAVFGAFRGGDGAASALYGALVILANLGLSAFIAVTAARFSPTALGAASMLGYPIRLGLVIASVLLVRNAPWFDGIAMAITIGVAHLGLLIWEARHVSLSFTYPALKPPGLGVSPMTKESR